MLNMKLENKLACFWRADRPMAADGSCGSEPFVAASIVYGSGAVF